METFQDVVRALGGEGWGSVLPKRQIGKSVRNPGGGVVSLRIVDPVADSIACGSSAITCHLCEGRFVGGGNRRGN